MARKTQNKPANQREGQDQNCLENWEEDLRSVTNALVTATAQADLAYKAYINSAKWEGKLKIYWENVDKTNDLIQEILAELKLYKVQAGNVCDNTQCVVDAVDVLFCYLRDFYRCTDALTTNLTNLINQIKCLNEPNLGSSIILKCLNDLSDKLGAAIADQQEVLKLIITILKQARILRATICETEGGEEKCSFVDLLGVLNGLFDQGAGAASTDDAECPPESSCDGTLTLYVTMPLDKDEYYKDTDKQYGLAQTETDTLKDEYYDKLEEKKKLEDCKKSLSDAIAAAKSAKDC